MIAAIVIRTADRRSSTIVTINPLNLLLCDYDAHISMIIHERDRKKTAVGVIHLFRTIWYDKL